MKNFDAIFHTAFLGIYIYHVFYFLGQYHLLRRIELFYYSMFLLSASCYYVAYVTPIVYNIVVHSSAQSFLSAFEMSFAFIQTYFYVAFIIAYLDLATGNKRVYKFFLFFKYYNLLFILVFILLGICHISSKNFYGIVALINIPFLLIALFLLRGFYSVYSNVVVLGTAFNIVGTVASMSMLSYEAYIHQKLPFNIYIPVQIGLLFDLFILGYGLSLKTAETDKKLVASLQENQQLVETERNRVARDLHDGLGGLLSGIKLTLNSMTGTIVLSEKNATTFTRAITQLDNAIAEMRRVAHNMMPEALLRFGLNEAIQDFCDGINESVGVKMRYNHIGNDRKIEKGTEVIIYRIVQELCNNAIKHAAAKHIFIQLNTHQKGVTLTVEDDGSGFNTSQPANNKGAGLKNLQSRIDYLKGTRDIKSEPGNGTSVNIEIPL